MFFRKIAIISGVIFLLVTAGYLYFRFGYLKTRNVKADQTKEKSFIDLRPSIIAKLQQLVYDASRGLYILTIHSIDPDLVHSTLNMEGVSIHFDSLVYRQMEKADQLPDDLYTMNFQLLHMDAVGIGNLFHTNNISIGGIVLTDPLITVYHKKQRYNLIKRKENDSLPLYKRILGKMTSLAIGKLTIEKGTFIDFDAAHKSKRTEYRGLSVYMKDIRVDSAAEMDSNKIIFAKEVLIGLQNYVLPTSDTLYTFSMDSMRLSGEQHNIAAYNIIVKSRYSRPEFEKRILTRKQLLHLVFPKTVITGMNWDVFMHHRSIKAAEVHIYDGALHAYFDLSKKRKRTITMDNFPHQMFMKVPFPVSIAKLVFHHLGISYEEYHPDIHKTGKLTFDDINAQITHLSTIPIEIIKYPFAEIKGTCLLLHQVPLSSTIRFDLSRARTGAFSADVSLEAMNKDLINPVAEDLGGAHINSGTLQSAVGHIEGNNLKTNGTILIKYSDLNITALKKAVDGTGTIKKKKLISLIANTFLIKHSNPLPDREIRKSVFTLERDHHSNFFNFVWVSFLSGILKTIGIPVKMVIK